MRRVLVLALLAVALPMAAWADIITMNTGGTVLISAMSGTGGLGTLGVSTITSKGAALTQYNSTTGHLGMVNYQTGALTSGSISGGGTFAGGGYFNIIGVGAWASALTGEKCGSGCSLFAGSFSSPLTWTLTGSTKNELFFSLTGSVAGVLYDGRDVTGTTTQYINILSKGQLNQGIGHGATGLTTLSVPEPGTLGLLGTGLFGIAGMFRRKLVGA